MTTRDWADPSLLPPQVDVMSTQSVPAPNVARLALDVTNEIFRMLKNERQHPYRISPAMGQAIEAEITRIFAPLEAQAALRAAAEEVLRVHGHRKERCKADPQKGTTCSLCGLRAALKDSSGSTMAMSHLCDSLAALDKEARDG